MILNYPERPTYAQKRLLDLVERRQLKKWCEQNDLNHSTVYRYASGSLVPSYRTMTELSSLIPPIEWLFYIDEKLPYEAVVVPVRDMTKPCKFCLEHRFDFKQIAKKYDLSYQNAYEVFYTQRYLPSIEIMRKLSVDVNPIEFFINAEQNFEAVETATRGDIISWSAEKFFVISSKKIGTGFVACKITALPTAFCVEFSYESNVNEYVNCADTSYIEASKMQKPILVGKAENEVVNQVLQKIREVVE